MINSWQAYNAKYKDNKTMAKQILKEMRVGKVDCEISRIEMPDGKNWLQYEFYAGTYDYQGKIVRRRQFGAAQLDDLPACIREAREWVQAQQHPRPERQPVQRSLAGTSDISDAIPENYLSNKEEDELPF